MSFIFGDGGAEDAKRAAQEQAEATRKAAAEQAEAARYSAQAAQIQREGLTARQAAEAKAQELAQKAPETPDVTIGEAAPADEEEARKRRNPRSSFVKRPAASSITL